MSMSIVSVKQMRRMEISEVDNFLYSLVDAGHYDRARILTNRVLSDPKMHAKNLELVSYCTTFQAFLNSHELEKLKAIVNEAKEKTEEAMATAMAAQSGVSILKNDMSDVLARIAALEESKNQKEGPKVFRNGRDIQSVSRTTPSMRDHAKIAGQKVIQDKQLKKEKQELFQQQVQMDKCKVLTACVV